MVQPAGLLPILSRPSGHVPEGIELGSESRSLRRSFPDGYKLDILSRAEELRALGGGRLKALLREEGLHTSHLAEWRKQAARGTLGESRRGRPVRSADALRAEIRLFKRRLRALEKRFLDSQRLLLLQKKYILAASLRMERKDRGLLSELMAQVEGSASISEACRALGLDRRDFYRTVKPRRKKRKD